MTIRDKQKHVKTQILEVLKQNKFGSSAHSISKELSLARNTVIKYLKLLKEEECAYEWFIGRYRIWIHRDFYIYLDQLKAPDDYVIYKFVRELVHSIQEICEIPEAQWHQVGKAISGNIDFKKLFPGEFISQIEQKYHEQGQNMQEMVKLYPTFIENTLMQLGDSTVVVDPPILNQDPLFVIFRLRNSKFCNSNAFFKIFCGIEEAELKHYYPNLTVSINGIYPEEKIVDLKFTFA